MNVYKVSYAAVSVAGEKGEIRSAKEGIATVLAEDPPSAARIAADNIPADEFHVNHVQELGRNVVGALIEPAPELAPAEDLV